LNILVSAHLTHKSVDLERLECIGGQDPRFILRSVKAMRGVVECTVLKTCNRLEIYAVSFEPKATRDDLRVFIDGFVDTAAGDSLVQFLEQQESVNHLLRVSAGLESLIVGEDQIQSQVKAAYELAEEEDCAHLVLSIIFRKAINVGKRVRTETRLSKGAVSVGSAAVDLAEKVVGPLEGKNVLIIGAGEMATLIAKHLIGKKPRTMFVSNRTFDHAEELAFALGGIAVRFDGLIECLSCSDVVLCATSSPHIVLSKDAVQQALLARGARSMIIIDVSFPRNVAPDVGEIEQVELYDIDGLRGIAQANLLARKTEISNAERIISREMALLDQKLEEMRGSELIGALYKKYHQMKENEIRKAINRLNGGNDDPEEVMEEFANALTKKFLAEPTQMLKEASREGNKEVMELVRDLFKIEEGLDVLPPKAH
jgi:glutamyl-tRNA reductase